MTTELNGLKVAILAENGFEQSELLKPKHALEQAGAKTTVISPQKGPIKGWNMTDWGQDVTVDKLLQEAKPEEYDALLLPGGVMNPDKLRMIPEAVAFVKHFFDKNKPVAAICHGPWLLVEAAVLAEKTLTSWPSIRTDIMNAGGRWVDQETVIDKNLLTSRKPDDIPAFNEKMLMLFAQRLLASSGI
jgi:protease I